MSETSLSTLLEHLHAPELADVSKGRLFVPTVPEPFVPPPIEATSLDSEIILVQAPAAVGKSTSARFLSAKLQAPLLDLANVPVSTGTLQTLLLDLLSGTDTLSAFHAGRLPVIVDALDEGRLLSTDRGFEAFLETTAELLARDRSITRQPKLIMFGRPEAIELAETGLALGNENLAFGRVTLNFFDATAAREVVGAFAQIATQRHPERATQYLKHPIPANDAVTAYFDAIAGALDIEKDLLWDDSRGRAFAGYAPVLGALGDVLAYVDNFPALINKLKKEGQRQAWGVIMSVLDVILDRERSKIVDKLEAKGIQATPETYDAFEQLTALVSHIQGSALGLSPRVKLPSPRDQSDYLTMVNQMLAEHPFVQDGEPANSVFAAVILSHGILQGTLNAKGQQQIEKASRHPFLWRSFRRFLDNENEPLVDGNYVGCLLASWTNDPECERGFCIGDNSNNHELMQFGVRSGQLERPKGPEDGEEPWAIFNSTLPVRLYGRARHVVIHATDGSVVLASDGAFDAIDFVSISCGSLEVTARDLAVAGLAMFEADAASSPPKFDIRMGEQSLLLCRGAISSIYPWNGLCRIWPETTNLPVLDRLVEQCMKRLPGTLVLQPDYVPTDDDRVRWVTRDFPNAFPAMIRLLIENGYASDEALVSGGAAKVRVRFHFSWPTLYRALRDVTYEGELRAVVDQARTSIQQA